METSGAHTRATGDQPTGPSATDSARAVFNAGNITSDYDSFDDFDDFDDTEEDTLDEDFDSEVDIEVERELQARHKDALRRDDYEHYDEEQGDDAADPDLLEDEDDDDDEPIHFCVTVQGTGTSWEVKHTRYFPETIAAVSRMVARLRAEGPAFALLCVDDDYFIIVRPSPKGNRVLLSDATAAIEDELAAAALEEIGVDVADLYDDDAEEPWAEGDFDILADLGCSEQVMNVICDDTELWASEQLLQIAAEVGFDEELAEEADLDLE